MMPDHVDVVVLGGGPAGCAAALTLAREGVGKVLVVESSHYESSRIGESIPPDSRHLFAELGLLDAFLAEGHEPCLGSCSSWGGDELGYNDFIFNPYGNGWHLDRRRFDAFLADAVRERGVELRTGTRYLEGRDGVVRLKDDDGIREVSSRFVVDATGCRSLYAHRRGARRRREDQLVVAAAFFDLPWGSPFGRLTMLEAVDYGWWYTARLPGGRIATAVATSHDLFVRPPAERRLDRPDVWLEALARTRHLAALLTECTLVDGSLTVCAASSFVLDRIHGRDWLAVGDAASSFDPISSQGIFKALSDGLEGGRAVAAHLAGHTKALAEHQVSVERRFADYERQRSYFYDVERRWPDAPFWSERRTLSSAAA